jgi:cytochrome c oxidase cbb3-type subunit 1
MTMRGQWGTITRSYALPFVWVGIGCYFVGSTQGSLEGTFNAQPILHFTNFTVGHSHLTMYGFVTFIAWGGIYGLLPLATRKQPNLIAVGVHFWFAFLGIVFYVISLSIAGILQGLTWASGNPFIASVATAQPFWLGRAVAGTMMFASHLIFAYNVWLMIGGKRPAAAPAAPTSTPSSPSPEPVAA